MFEFSGHLPHSIFNIKTIPLIRPFLDIPKSGLNMGIFLYSSTPKAPFLNPQLNIYCRGIHCKYDRIFLQLSSQAPTHYKQLCRRNSLFFPLYQNVVSDRCLDTPSHNHRTLTGSDSSLHPGNKSNGLYQTREGERESQRPTRFKNSKNDNMIRELHISAEQNIEKHLKLMAILACLRFLSHNALFVISCCFKR